MARSPEFGLLPPCFIADIHTWFPQTGGYHTLTPLAVIGFEYEVVLGELARGTA